MKAEHEDVVPRTSRFLTAGTTSHSQWSRLLLHSDAVTFSLGLLVGLLVCLPFYGGRLYLLDWSLGPHTGIAGASALGLNGGLTAGIGGAVAAGLLSSWFGGAATWLPLLAFFPIAMVGAGRLTGRSLWSRVAAGTLYAINPFVFNRIFAGHVFLLVGYALLPFAVEATMRSIRSPKIRWSIPALWWAGLTSLSPHFAWIFGLVVAAVALVTVVQRSRPWRSVAGWFVASIGLFTLMSSYLLLPHSTTTLPTQVGPVSLALYRTQGDPHLGLFANVAGLYGFWRIGPGPQMAKDVMSGWPFILFAVIVIIAVGARGALRARDPKVGGATAGPHDANPLPSSAAADFGAVPANSSSSSSNDERQLAIVLVVTGVIGFLLALGDQGPTGRVFLWMYDYVPFFNVMREPQKFVMLVALAYAVFFGWGVERLSRVTLQPLRIGTAVVAVVIGVALPIGYTPTIVNGLAGQVSSSALPSAYQQADDLMGVGPGNVLYLPWHIYMEYPFTNGRVVANVAANTFRRSVISGDNVEASGVETQSTSPRSAFLQQLFASGTKISDFGALVAPLGVRYVVLAKTADWPLYRWLSGQTDLRVVLNTSALEVWQNIAYVGVGTRVSALASTPDFAGLLGLAKAHSLNHGAVTFGGGAAPTPVTSSTTQQSTLKGIASVKELSPVAYRVGPGRPGWVVVDAPFQIGWSLDGVAATPSALGTVLVPVGSKGGVLRFIPWARVRLGYEISVSVFIVLLVLLYVDRRRRSKAHRLTTEE